MLRRTRRACFGPFHHTKICPACQHIFRYFSQYFIASRPSRAPLGAGILGGDAPLRPARFLPRGAVITSFGRPAGGVFPAPLQRREVNLCHIIPAVAQEL